MSYGEKSSNPATDSVSPETVPWERVEKFFGQLSHDLRNGLNACELQLTFLGEVSADAEVAEDIKRLRASLAGITRQLQHVRVSMGGATGHLMDYPALDLAEDLKERFERAHPEAAGRVQWDIEVPATTQVCVDPELVLASCLEILNNALYFAAKEERVTCQVRSGQDHQQVLLTAAHPLVDLPTISLGEWGWSPLLSTRRGAYGLGLFRARRALTASGCGLEFRWSPEQKILTAVVTLPGAVAPTGPA